MIVPTRRTVVLVMFAVPISAGSIVISSGLWPVAIAYLSVLVLFLVYDSRRGVDAPSMEILPDKPPNLLFVNERTDFGVTFQTGPAGAGTKIEVLVDTSSFLEILPSYFINLDDKGRARIVLSLRPLRRGTVSLETVWVRWHGPLGLTEHIAHTDLNLEFAVTPNTQAVRRHAILLQRKASIYGIKPQLFQGDGSEFDSLREFVTGLDKRSVDWKHTARHRKLVCKEFIAERNHNIVLGIDCGYLMREQVDGVPKLDWAINSALILAYQALQTGDKVGTFGFHSSVQHFQSPASGIETFGDIRLALSELEYSLEETNFTLGLVTLMKELDRSSLIILLTDFLDSVSAEFMMDILEMLAKRHHVVFAALGDRGIELEAQAELHGIDDLARAVTAANLIRERNRVLEQLTHHGIQAFDVPPRNLDSALINRYLTIKNRARAHP